MQTFKYIKKLNYKNNVTVVGTCVFVYGMKQGELCRRDSECETGLMCAEMPGRETKSCQPPTTSNKLYSALTKQFL